MPLPCHVSEPRSPGAWHRPESPHLLARRLIERGDESAHAFVAARRAGDDEVPDRKRRARGVVVLTPVGHLGFPEQRSGVPIERDEVRVIGDHEHAVAGDADTAIDAARRVSDQALRSRTLIAPDLAAAAGIERVALVGARHVHHAFDDDRRHLEARGVEAVDPLRRQPCRRWSGVICES